ncbi:hypothetical protein JAO73_11855 [Hymenobacter sp. BT523]|uniref:hypothetical protein n=1 Tax=Hymenobacter sp. BT523 TaxID=2795725 RepID=UPI0018EACC99|nr:hypothetical protein [Hymenobacter sp. BT523]MBJ6109711.1 hypothetical protein [Hymenobacter sp. BT523]
MFTLRSALFFPLLACGSLLLGSCGDKKDSLPKPENPADRVLTPEQMLTGHTWLLSRTVFNNSRSVASPQGPNTQYTIKFAAGGTYTQVWIGNNSTTTGTWTLDSNNNLDLSEFRGGGYKIDSLTTNKLRYSFTNRASVPEARVFSALP